MQMARRLNQDYLQRWAHLGLEQRHKIIKAMRKGDEWLANRVYSGVPAELFGCEQVIEIGPMSGESNVVFWLEQRGIVAHPALVSAILEAAKEGHGLLSDADVRRVVERVAPKSAGLRSP